MADITIPYSPRAHQLEIHNKRKRFSVLVCHRRFGKTVAAVNELIKSACTCPRPSPRYAYIAPMYKQAKAVAWDYLQLYTRAIPGMQYNVAELRADFPNGARVSLLGADNPDGLRGIYLDGVVLDEYAQMPPPLWGEVIRPTLSDRKGWALFIGTPQGHNVFWDMYSGAMDLMAQGDTDWWAAMYRASETGIVDAVELESSKRSMTPEQYEQEFECSFTAAIMGAYYARDMADAESQGRITGVPHDPAILVHTAWDLGMSDSMAIWFFQLSPGGEVRVIDYHEDYGHGLDKYILVLSERGYMYGTHLAPHDIRVRELGTGKSRLETAKSLGITFTLTPNLHIADGINAARMTIPKCWFDRAKCKTGIEALTMYRQRYNERTGLFSDQPHHDWTSHAADAFRYLAVGMSKVSIGGTMTASRAREMYNQYAPPVGA